MDIFRYGTNCDINEAFSLGILKGITTNPTILLKKDKPRYFSIKEILEATEGMVFVQAIGNTFEEI